MALAVSVAAGNLQNRLVFARGVPPTLVEIASKIGATLEEGVDAAISVRKALAPLAAQQEILTGLAFRGAMAEAMQSFLKGGAPTDELLALMGRQAVVMGLALDSLASRRVSPAEVARRIQEGDRRRVPRRLGLSAVTRKLIEDSGPRPGAAEVVQGRVIADWDKTLYKRDSFIDLVWHGLLTRFRQITSLPRPFHRLVTAIVMARAYKAHRLHAPVAARQVAALLDGLPVKAVAREWARAGAREGINQGVKSVLLRRAKAIVLMEWEKAGKKRPERLPDEEEAVFDARIKTFDRELDQEAHRRVDINSSQETVALLALVAVEEGAEDVLGIPPENIIASTGTYDDNGCYVNDGTGIYCFGEVKPVRQLEANRARGIVLDPETTVAATDNTYYDGPVLLLASPRNRIVVNPHPADLEYARSWGTGIILDQWDEFTEAQYEPTERAGWAAGWSGHPGMRLVFHQRHRFFPDSRSRLTRFDILNRAFFGALDMLPASLFEFFGHRGDNQWAHVAAAAIPMAAGLTYGVMNRTVKAHALVGAMVGGGLTAYHTGGFRFWPTVVGAVTLPAAHIIASRAVFQGQSARLGPEGYGRPLARILHWLERLGVTTAWAALMKVVVR